VLRSLTPIRFSDVELQAYGKQIVKSVPLETTSGPVIYTNLLGFLPMLFLASVGNEYNKAQTFMAEKATIGISSAAIVYLILGSLVGTGIGYSGWWCRSVVSATSFTLIGVMNKFLTILLNLVMWDQHATNGGILALLVCIAGGSIYEQAPMRNDAKKDTKGDTSIQDIEENADDGEEVALIEKGSPGKRRG